MSGNLSGNDQHYQYQFLYLERLFSPLCLCVEGIVRPRLNPPLCAASVRRLSISAVELSELKRGWEGFRKASGLGPQPGTELVLLRLKLRTAHCDWLR